MTGVAGGRAGVTQKLCSRRGGRGGGASRCGGETGSPPNTAGTGGESQARGGAGAAGGRVKLPGAGAGVGGFLTKADHTGLLLKTDQGGQVSPRGRVGGEDLGWAVLVTLTVGFLLELDFTRENAQVDQDKVRKPDSGTASKACLSVPGAGASGRSRGGRCRQGGVTTCTIRGSEWEPCSNTLLKIAFFF